LLLFELALILRLLALLFLLLLALLFLRPGRCLASIA
jgi:hypothetical protein